MSYNALVQPTDNWTETIKRIHNQETYIPKNYIKHEKLKRILIVNPGWLRVVFKNNLSGTAWFRKANCAITDCELLSNVTNNYRDADAIIFQNAIDRKIIDFRRRNRSQVWIVLLLESPARWPRYEALDGLVNWTITYRRASTIPDPYFHRTVPLSANEFRQRKIQSVSNKTGLVAWVVSNWWSTKNDRAKYARELGKYIKVDIFGSGNKFCNRTTCFQSLSEKYKFYLAFENSNCAEYITEKFYRNSLR